MIPSSAHAGRRRLSPSRRLVTCGDERQEKNTGRAMLRARMSRRTGTVYLSASISSSAHPRLKISSPSSACIITTTFLLWQIARLYSRGADLWSLKNKCNNASQSHGAYYRRVSVEGSVMEAAQTRQFALRLPMRLHSQERYRAPRRRNHCKLRQI